MQKDRICVLSRNQIVLEFALEPKWYNCVDIKGTYKAKGGGGGGATCKNCGKKNHFARVCETKKKIDKLYKEPVTKSDGSLDYDYDSKEIHLDKMTALCSVSGRKYPSTMIDVSTNNTILKMEVDSGAEANVITYSEFLKLSGITLEPTQAKLKPYNSESIQCKGMFKATITSNKTQVQATFYVSEGTVKYNLMGKFTAFDLGILQIKTNQLHSSETNQFQEERHNYKQQKNSEKNNEKVQHMEYRNVAVHQTPKSACKHLEQELEAKSATQKEKIDHIIKYFDVVFEGIGKHRYRQVKLHID